MIPEGNVPLHEIYERFSNLDPDGIGRLDPFPTHEAAAEKWWAEVDRRQAHSLAKFKAALEAGQLTVKVERAGRVYEITCEQWRRHDPIFVSSIQFEIIKELGNDGLVECNGLKPFVCKSEAEKFLKSYFGLPSKVTATTRGRKPDFAWQELDSVCMQFLEQHGAFDPDDTHMPNQAALERKMTEWAEAKVGCPGWPRVPSESHIRSRVAKVLKDFRKA